MHWLKVADRPRAVALANFEDNAPHRLRLTVGDVVCIEQQTENWYRGFNVNIRSVRGIFPRNCVSIREGERAGADYESDTPFLTELTAMIQEYGRIAKERFVKGDRETYELVRRTLFELVQTRRIVLTGKLAEAEKRSRMLEAARKIDHANRVLKQDLVIRDEHLGLVRADNCGVVSLFRRHVTACAQQTSDRGSGGSGSGNVVGANASEVQTADATSEWRESDMASGAFGVQLTVRNLTCDLKKVGEVEASLFVADANFQPLTERYTFKWPPRTVTASSEPHTIVFREFGAEDTQRDSVQLVCQVTSFFCEPAKTAEAEHFRRAETTWKVPFACGAFDLKATFRKPGTTNENMGQAGAGAGLFDDAEREPESQLAMCAIEKNELFCDVLARRKEGGRGALVFSLRRVELLPGGAKPAGTPVRALRFVDAVPVAGDDEERNDLYLVVRNGEFARGGKKADRNVEVNVSVRLSAPPGDPPVQAFRDYELMPSANSAPMRTYRTVAFYHQNAPRWFDTLRVALPASNQALGNAHVRFTLRHRSRQVKTDLEGLFAVAYLRLQSENGTIQPDGPHKLAVYRVEGRLDDANYSYLTMSSTYQAASKVPPKTAGGVSLLPSRDWLEVATLLTSRLFTQDESLLGVLSWQRLIEKQPIELLRHIRFLAITATPSTPNTGSRRVELLASNSKRGGDLLKFLDSVLEALFGVLIKVGDSGCLPLAERANRVEFEQAVFDALVRVILFVTQAGRILLLDKYVDERFSATRVHVVLMELLTAYVGYAVHLDAPDLSASADADMSASYWRHLSAQLAPATVADRGTLLSAFREPLENMIKCLRPLLRFVARSRLADEALLCADATWDQRFDTALSAFFRQLRLFMLRASERAAQLQSQLLKVLPDTLDVLQELQPRIGVAQLFVDLVDAVPTQARCMAFTLFALQRVVSGTIFRFADCRAVLLPKLVTYLHENLLAELSPANATAFRGEPVRQCADILLDALDVLHALAREGQATQTDLAQLATSLLRTLAFAVHAVDRVERAPANPLKQSLTGALLALLHQLTDAQLTALFDAEPYRELICLHDLLLELLNAFGDLLSEPPLSANARIPASPSRSRLLRQPAFAADWFEMTLAQASIIQRVLVLVARKIRERLPTPDVAIIEYEYQIDCWYAVWMRFFETSFAFITQRCVSVERFSAAKRDSVLLRYGDMRVRIVEQVESLWFSLDKHKQRFMPQILPSFLRMTMACSSQTLRRRAMRVLFDMFAFEWRLRKTLKRAEHEFITALDRLLELGLGDEQYRDVFVSEMHALAAASPANPFAHEHPDLVTMSAQLMGSLLQYRRVTACVDETLFDVRTLAIVSLLSVYDTLRRDELYNRYVLKLAELHEACSNHVEQGFALLVLANRLEWNNQPLPDSHACLLQDEGKAASWLHLPIPVADAATAATLVAQRDIKFSLLLRVYECFRRGKLWERAIAVLKQLVSQCEGQLFNYVQLSELLRKQAECYENIISDKMRYSPPLHYYKVGFYGKDFFPFLSNREFIYRGEPTELIGTLLERIKLQFPAAEQLHGPVTQAHKDSNRQYLSLLPVEPQAYVVADDKFQVDEQILEYYCMNEIHAFCTKDMLANGPRKSNPDDVINLWMEGVDMFTANMGLPDTPNRGSVTLGDYVRGHANAERDQNAEVRVHLDRFPTIVRWLPICETQRTLLTPVQNAIIAVRGQHRQLVKAVARFVEKHDKVEVQSLLRVVSGLIEAAVNGGLNKYTPFFKDEYLENPQNEGQAKFIPEFCNVIADVSVAAYSAMMALGEQPTLLGEMREKFEYMIGSFQDFVANIERDFGVKLTEKEQKLAALKLRSTQNASLLKNTSAQNLSLTNLTGSSNQLANRRPSGTSSMHLPGLADGRLPASSQMQRNVTLNGSNNSLSGQSARSKDEVETNGPSTSITTKRQSTVQKFVAPVMTFFKGSKASESLGSPSETQNAPVAVLEVDKRRSTASQNSAASTTSLDSKNVEISTTDSGASPTSEKVRACVLNTQIPAQDMQVRAATVQHVPQRTPRPSVAGSVANTASISQFANRPLPPPPTENSAPVPVVEDEANSIVPARAPPRPPRPSRSVNAHPNDVQRS